MRTQEGTGTGTQPPLTARPIHRVLLTGTSGRIGRVLRERLRGRWPVLRISMHSAPVDEARDGEELVQADITDLASMERAMEGVDAVIHMSASSEGRDFDVINRLNILGLYNTVEAAKRQGVRRFVFASSNHAMGWYPVTEPLTPDSPPRPDTYYGISKVFGEALLRYYVDKHGMEAVCVRIGSFQPEPQDQRQLATWLSHDDMTQLAIRGVEAPGVTFLVVLGFSANVRLPAYDPNAARIGYAPKDNAEDYVETLRAKGVDVDGELEWKRLGGPFTALDFDQ